MKTTAFHTIAKLNLIIANQEEEIAKVKKIMQQQIDKYESWNKHDCKIIGELRKRNKELESMKKPEDYVIKEVTKILEEWKSGKNK